MMNATATFSIGQAVRWPHAPLKIAQVSELLRSNVRLVYRSRRRGRLHSPVVNAFALLAMQDPADPLLPIANLMGRGIVRPKTKTFKARDSR